MRILLCLGLCLLSLQSFSQEKCAFVEHNKRQLNGSDPSGQGASFEKWMQHKQKELGSAMRTATAAGTNARYVIPVVVHVIHHGEALGQGANIPKEQILSQIKTLNEDFRALNATEINKLSAQFKTLVADTEIEFVLAKQDPEGVETDGIVRVASTKVNWQQNEDLRLKALSQWPPDKYLNLYSADIAYPVLGWAQFPQSSQLEGVNIGDLSEASDGVVIDYRYLGQGYQAISSSRGRTATHEIGHYFGLRHIWGDGNCSVDDFVSDTPLVDKSHSGCPKQDGPKACDSNPAMFQNFMDYTDDECMALFTTGQKQRMEVVLQNSPRRKNLPSSIGGQEPIIVTNDAGLRQLHLTPGPQCNGTYTPTLQVRNYGSNQVTKVQISLSLDNQLLNTYTFATKLNYLESQELELEGIPITQAGQRTLSATITLTNDTQDGKSTNNSASASLFVPFRASLPFSQDFQQGVAPFYVINPDESFSWEHRAAPNGTTSGNMAVFMNFYDYPEVAQKDILASPILDLSQEKSFYVSLRAAYARFDRGSNDGLEIWVSTDCQSRLQTATQVFRISGEALATSPEANDPFVPKDASHWSTLGLDLSNYAGQSQVQLLFVGVNDYGNNLYLDDIRFSNSPLTPLNISLSKLLEPSPVFGAFKTPVGVQVKNSGSEPIESLRFKVFLNGEQINDLSFQNLGLQPKENKQLSLGSISQLIEGIHVVKVQVYDPNGKPDGMDFDNSLSKQLVVNKSQKTIPLRERFGAETLMDGEWTAINPDPAGQSWLTQQAMGPNGEGAGANFAAASQFTSSSWLQERWLATPMLSIQNTPEAGVQFWYYAAGSGEHSLKVLASTDGGLSWPVELWKKEGSELNPKGATDPMVPATADQWRKAVLDLSSLIGHDQVRLALVATGRGPSVVYADEIEFFLSEPSEVSLYPNPSQGMYNLLFNMKNTQGEDVTVEIINSRGQLIGTKVYPRTSNQIYTEELQGLPAGIYYLRIRSASLNTTRKLLLTH